MPVVITKEKFKLIFGTQQGVPTRSQAGVVGIPYPLQKGWTKNFIGSSISDDQYNKLIKLRDDRIAFKAGKRIQQQPIKKPKKKQVRKTPKVDDLYHKPNTVFIKNPGRGNKKYYAPEWMELRDKALDRDGHKCINCGATRKLNVHHLCYIKGKKVWEVPLWYLVTLCETCHAKEHKKRLKAPPYLESI